MNEIRFSAVKRALEDPCRLGAPLIHAPCAAFGRSETSTDENGSPTGA
jgi:hypothetical protein